MTQTRKALRATVFVGDSHQYHHRPVYTEIVHRAHAAGLAGVTVLHGVEGFGASTRIHQPHLLRLSQDLPMIVLIVDEPDKVRRFLPQIDELVKAGMIFLDEVTVVAPVT